MPPYVGALPHVAELQLVRSLQADGDGSTVRHTILHAVPAVDEAAFQTRFWTTVAFVVASLAALFALFFVKAKAHVVFTVGEWIPVL
jgi:hypothetical protein